MGRKSKPSNTRKSARSLFDILRFVPIRIFHVWLDDVGHDELREQAGLAVAWRPEELRQYHDDVCQ